MNTYTYAKRNDVDYDIGTPGEIQAMTAQYAIFDHMKNCVGFVRSENEARLLALAPELLEALKLAVQYVGKGVADGAYDGCVVSGESALSRIEATLKKTGTY
jgi:hypothetical protein